MTKMFILADNQAQFQLMRTKFSDVFNVRLTDIVMLNERMNSQHWQGRDNFIVVECEGFFAKLPHRSHETVGARLDLADRIQTRRGVLWLVEQDFYRARHAVNAVGS